MGDKLSSLLSLSSVCYSPLKEAKEEEWCAIWGNITPLPIQLVHCTESVLHLSMQMELSDLEHSFGLIILNSQRVFRVDGFRRKQLTKCHLLYNLREDKSKERLGLASSLKPEHVQTVTHFDSLPGEKKPKKQMDGLRLYKMNRYICFRGTSKTCRVGVISEAHMEYQLWLVKL